MDGASPDAFVEFAKKESCTCRNEIIIIVSSERTTEEGYQTSASTISNWVKAVELFFEINDTQLN
jgi:hypothetical protein